MIWVAACCLWKQPLSTERYGYAYTPTCANTHCAKIQHDLLLSLWLHQTHFTHSVILTCTHKPCWFWSVHSGGTCSLLRCWNTAKVHGCNTSHEHRGPPPTELRLEVVLPVRLKLKMEKRLEMGWRRACQRGWGSSLYFTIVLGKWSGNRLQMVLAAYRKLWNCAWSAQLPTVTLERFH